MDDDEIKVTPHLQQFDRQQEGELSNAEGIRQFNKMWQQGPEAIYDRLAAEKTPEELARARDNYIAYLIKYRDNDPEGVDEKLRNLGVDVSAYSQNQTTIQSPENSVPNNADSQNDNQSPKEEDVSLSR